MEARTQSYVIYILDIKIVLEVQQEHYRVKSQLVPYINFHSMGNITFTNIVVEHKTINHLLPLLIRIY